MQWNSNQIDILAKYFADLSKVIVISTVIGFFLPIGAALVTAQTFIIGAVSAFVCLFISIKLLK
ncbi:hypothetical protein A2W54_04635 [Candidatus Giovannonibacteria bacterium RIFCSPHIGHO2_02_43_13]|uniref:Uncharacterized protein n=1 Tax=Candidatus Giovannonibacteria bacterium RIFCSPHIGHO2_02_43_13 TaxID=1798330 RepID=A0A1F5WS12_9BACT|nr:MAG: hypothetical protein A3E06_01735 [Candidatus Giovannonibacteria bacterium RIFCSPHIGHO2_12_FULL_44_42]OGF78453.1 MAG: hypothetical protein A2W54_04635 [Candidatus Giovannonibacteria bacterium RIFCSPHIGHO2_02_43_13]OGF88647.1 MAG: hypothetical protein A3I94_04020 [Candidatus Giovannonibacteria bacterium RIFCSPLOWO2_02_FULL_43_54]OGF97562.1 MAG: hypothetical protein A3H08_00465 [Candidatus Giovannonibacteria bacterium RIFCSPLOWO2_12_FULL_44_32]